MRELEHVLVNWAEIWGIKRSESLGAENGTKGKPTSVFLFQFPIQLMLEIVNDTVDVGCKARLGPKYFLMAPEGV